MSKRKIPQKPQGFLGFFCWRDMKLRDRIYFFIQNYENSARTAFLKYLRVPAHLQGFSKSLLPGNQDKRCNQLRSWFLCVLQGLLPVPVCIPSSLHQDYQAVPVKCRRILSFSHHRQLSYLCCFQNIRSSHRVWVLFAVHS